MKEPSEELLQAIAVTSELTGTVLTAPAARIMGQDLAQFPEHQVMDALRRCRREIRTRLTIADVVARIDDGRPGPEEAWAHCAALLDDEGATIVWTREEKTAFFACHRLTDDTIAARMAFLEAYRKAVLQARNDGDPVTWEPCLGHRSRDREAPLLEAVELGRLPPAHAKLLLPHDDAVVLERLYAGVAERKRLK